jgi:hypothetical protein
MDSRKVIRYLKQYGQQQTLGAIREFVDPDVTREDLDKLVKEGKIANADGGKDERGEPIAAYAPVDSEDD